MPLSLAALQAALAQETGEVFATCVTITHSSLATPLRLVDNTEDLSRASGTFLAFPFEITLPAQQDDKPPTVTLRLDGVDQTAASIIRGFTSPASVSLEVVLASSPNTVEAGPFDLTLRAARIVAGAVECDLAFEDFLNEPFPAGTFNPSDFAGLFI